MRLSSGIIAVKLTRSPSNFFPVVLLVAWKATVNQLFQHPSHHCHSQVHITKVFRNIEGASNDGDPDQHSQDGAVVGEGHARGLVLGTLEVAENVFPGNY